MAALRMAAFLTASVVAGRGRSDSQPFACRNVATVASTNVLPDTLYCLCPGQREARRRCVGCARTLVTGPPRLRVVQRLLRADD
jgi:hypothetical protein